MNKRLEKIREAYKGGMDILPEKNALEILVDLHSILGIVDSLTKERDEYKDILRREGFEECDIPACNCGSWHHRYGLPERFQEIREELAEAGVLNNSTGNLPINAIKKLREERDALREAIERYVNTRQVYAIMTWADRRNPPYEVETMPYHKAYDAAWDRLKALAAHEALKEGK